MIAVHAELRMTESGTGLRIYWLQRESGLVPAGQDELAFRDPPLKGPLPPDEQPSRTS